MFGAGLVSILIGFSAFYLFNAPVEWSLTIGAMAFCVFALNLARAENDELKMILDKAQPDWRERNANWTSTWDWNRLIKKRFRKQQGQNQTSGEK